MPGDEVAVLLPDNKNSHRNSNSNTYTYIIAISYHHNLFTTFSLF